MPKTAFTTPDLSSEGSMDRLIALASTALSCEMGLVSVFGPEQTVFRATTGIDIDCIDSDVSVTRRLMEMGADGLLVVEDGRSDPRVKDHPLVTGAPFLSFYAGATIVDATGEPVGAIGVMDTAPRGPLSQAETRTLRRFARLAGDLIDQAAAARRSCEQLTLLKLAEQMSGVGHWRLEVATGRVTWSDEVRRIHAAPDGFDPNYDGAVNRYLPEDAEVLRTAVERAIETGEGYELTLRITDFEGRQRQVTAKATTERDETGKVAALFGVFQDVTDQTEAKARLEESEALFRLLSEDARDIIARYDPEGRFLYLSPAVETVTGARPETIVGRTCEDIVHRDDYPTVKALLTAYAAAGPTATPPRFEYRTRRTDGTWIWLEASPRGVFDAEGRLIEYHDTVRDITERKALEAQLIEARDRAEAAARVKSEFLANMSHELRTPLTSVIGFSGLLLGSSNLGPTERQFADRIATASDSLLSVINDILDYSKLEADAVELDPAPFEPRRMVEAAVSLIEAQAMVKGLTLTVEIDPATPETVMGDEGRLRQVTLNFLSNALKFTPSGEIRLNLRWLDGRMRLEVIDTGIGAEPAKIEALFERFTQADTSTTRHYGGTGLGLAISRRITEMMGGQIGASSAPGEGSTFWFEVPLASAEAARAATTPAVAADMDGLRVLMVDDSAANRELVSALLRGLGLSVETAEDGVQAVQAASGGGFDLILMDINMPTMDGLAATRAIRALGGPAARVPIVALSASVQPEQVELCRAAGMDDHVGKPIQLTALIAGMQRVLEARETGREDAA